MLIEIKATEIDIQEHGSCVFGDEIKNNIYKTYIYNTTTGELFNLKRDNIGKFNIDHKLPLRENSYMYINIIDTPNLNSYIRIHPEYNRIIENSPYAIQCSKKVMEHINSDI